MRAARGRARIERVLRVYGSREERATGRRDERRKEKAEDKARSASTASKERLRDRQWRSRGGARMRGRTRVRRSLVTSAPCSRVAVRGKGGGGGGS